ncbi:MAG: hypothetical protein L0099_04520, partial [Acidobacteria bacterium]|nr:hypothetical protein [Acidobacteriota bacterium]
VAAPLTMVMFRSTLPILLLLVSVRPSESQAQEWPHYGGDAGGSKYSTLKQINQQNVTQLKVAWTYHTGEISDGSTLPVRTAFECTPLVVDGILYLSTPFGRAVALEAVLVPIATTVILSQLVIAGARWFERPVVRVVNVLLVAALVIAGLVLTWQDFQTNHNELPLLEYVKANKDKGDVYLLPVEAPDLAAAPGAIPSELQRFRLYTGAAIFVDFKSIPYKDTDVLEWHRRIRLNQTLLAQMRAGQEEDVRAELKRSGITHVVTKTGQELKGSGFVQVHEDRVYRVYRATSQCWQSIGRNRARGRSPRRASAAWARRGPSAAPAWPLAAPASAAWPRSHHRSTRSQWRLRP